MHSGLPELVLIVIRRGFNCFLEFIQGDVFPCANESMIATLSVLPRGIIMPVLNCYAFFRNPLSGSM